MAHMKIYLLYKYFFSDGIKKPRNEERIRGFNIATVNTVALLHLLS